MGEHRKPRRAKFGAFLLLVVIAVGSATWISIQVTKRQDDEKHAAELAKSQALEQANTIADPILAICAGGGDAAKVLASARTPDGQSVCGVASGVKASAPPAPDGLSQSEVKALINQALARQQPAQPTPQQLAQAVQAFLTANPSMFKGPAPTAAQIQSAVNEYMRTHPVTQPVPSVPSYQFPGIGGFTGEPPFPQRWPTPRQRTPR